MKVPMGFSATSKELRFKTGKEIADDHWLQIKAHYQYRHRLCLEDTLDKYLCMRVNPKPEMPDEH
jgi:hypothetical protein